MPAPTRHLVHGIDQHVDRDAQGPQRAPQPDHFRRAIGDLRLDDQQVEVRVFSRIAAGVRAEQQDTLRVGDLCQYADGGIDPRMRSNSAKSARCARFRKYASVRSAAAFSAAATLMN